MRYGVRTRRDFIVGFAAGGLGLLSAPWPCLGKRHEGGIEIVPRSDWADVGAVQRRMRRASKFTRLTVHHAGGVARRETAFNAVVFRLQSVQTGHMNHDFGDIAYHFVIDYAGRIWEGRSLAYEGAHVSGANAGNIGIMALGNFEQQRPADLQLDSLVRLVHHLRELYGIAGSGVYGHRDLGHSVCPGRYLYGQIDRLRTGNGGRNAVGRNNQSPA